MDHVDSRSSRLLLATIFLPNVAKDAAADGEVSSNRSCKLLTYFFNQFHFHSWIKFIRKRLSEAER